MAEADGEVMSDREDMDRDVVGSSAMRPVFLGNLSNAYTAEDIKEIFERPIQPKGGDYAPIDVDRVDLKRGYCFVFLKDAASENDKERAERFVSDINGMSVNNVSNALRAEFARGDGRIKRKEDDRRKKIQPNETLFVVNFHEQTTKREHLEMLFEPYGKLVRIDMKRNYAFVQFRTVEEAKRAKEETNGQKLDSSVLTVEYVARQRGEGGGRRDRDRRSRDFYDRDRRDRYYDDRRRGGYDDRRSSGYGDDRGGGGYGDRRDSGDRSYGMPRSPRRRSRSYSPGRRGRRGRSRSPPRRSWSRSRSPPYRGRSPRGGGYRG